MECLCRKAPLFIRRRLCHFTPRVLAAQAVVVTVLVYSFLYASRFKASDVFTGDKSSILTYLQSQESGVVAGFKRSGTLYNVSNKIMEVKLKAGKHIEDLKASVKEAKHVLHIQTEVNDVTHPLTLPTVPKCQPRTCNKGICFENLQCLDLPPFLSNFKNPCFMERVTKDDSDQNSHGNYIIRRMVPNPDIPAVQSFHDNWQARRSETKYQLRCLPYFFIIGMEKCGTTDVYQRIGLHPDIVLSPAKELQWWTRRRFFYTKGNNFPPKLQSDRFKLDNIQNLTNVPFKHYYAFFDKVADDIAAHKNVTDSDGKTYHNAITGDGSPNTMYWNDFSSIYGPNNIDGGKTLVAHHIAATLPQARIIAILRNPTDRLYSSYLFFNRAGSKQKFHNIVEKGIKLFSECLINSTLQECTYDAALKEEMGSTVNLMQGLYSVMLEDWYKLFPRHQIHIAHFESYKQSEIEEINKIFKFLDRKEINEESAIGKRIMKKSVALAGKQHDAVGEMTNTTRKLLDDFYRPYNEQLSKLLGDERYLWPQ